MNTNADLPHGEYRTSDMYYAAYLRVCKVPFMDTEVEGTRVWFLFENQGAQVMRDLKAQYFNGRAKVSALDYAQALKITKVLLHEQ